MSPAPLPKDPAARLAELQRRLAAVDGFVDEAIPPLAQSLLVELRQTSVALIREVVARLAEGRGLQALSEEEIRRAVEESARREGASLVLSGEPFTAESANGQWGVQVTRSRVSPGYLVVSFDFRIPCGSDGGFVLYDRRSPATEPLLAVTAPKSDTIEPLFWQPHFALPPPSEPPQIFFAFTRITPWCQSAQRQMRLVVLAPSDDPLAPRRLIDETQSHHLQKPFRLDVQRDLITWETHDGIEAHVTRWRRRGDRFEPM